MIQSPSHTNFGIFSAPQKESSYPVAVTPIPHPWATSNLLSVSMFALLDVLCKCYHTIDNLFWLASFRSTTFSRFIFFVDKQLLPVWMEPDTNPSPADGHHVCCLTLGSGEGRRCELSLVSFMWTCAHVSRLSLPGRLCANILGTSAVTAVELQDHWRRLSLGELSAPPGLSLSVSLPAFLSLSLPLSRPPCLSPSGHSAPAA